MTTSEARGFPWVLTVLAAIVLAVLLSLGVWQVRRMAWKEGLIDQAAAAAALPPVPADEILSRPGGEFRRVILDCPGLDAAPFVELQSIHDGDAGVRLISACRPAGVGTTFLVDRGFVADADPARPAVDARAAEPVRVTAVVREAPRPNWMSPPPQDGRFFARDPEAMARALGVDGATDSRVLFAETSTNPGLPALVPAVPPPAFSNNHLGYAITWFGLAAALVVFYGLMLRRRLRPGQRHGAETGQDKA
ncbi:MAG: SURF1 family protein [Brevundimonas sp.]